MTRTFAINIPLTLQDPSLGERWRAIREANRLTQDGVAAILGCSVQTIIAIENDRHERSAWMGQMAELYRVPLGTVLRPFVALDRAADQEDAWMSIGEAVKRRRQRMGWTRAEFAADAGTTYQRLRRLEEDDRLPPRADLERIAAQLGVDLDEDLLQRGPREDLPWEAVANG